MHVRVFTLRFDPATESFDDAQLRQFLADKAVCEVREHFFVQDGVHYLTLVVTYHPHATPLAAPAGKREAGPRQRDESWREYLDKADWPLWPREPAMSLHRWTSIAMASTARSKPAAQHDVGHRRSPGAQPFRR